MKIGVFIPIANNGWLISSNAPQYMPSFALNRAIVERAEAHGFDFALSMIKLHGFGGETEFWDHALESFTLMAGLAAVTSRIALYATVATLTLPPAIAARMAATIDDISGGRFGINIVSGWNKPEYAQMGLWPGEAHFGRRYVYSAEYVTILRELWTTGRSDFKGAYFSMDNCVLSPRPGERVKIVTAGQSDTGMRFAAAHADYNFCFGRGLNTPTAFADNAERLRAACAETGRDCTSLVLLMVIAAATDAEAMARWHHYQAGADQAALANIAAQGAADRKPDANTNVRQMSEADGAINLNMGTLVGSYARIAAMLDEIAAVPGTGGVMLTFDDFVGGIEEFGTRIQPLMTSRA